jgi:hypothetical protein
MSLQTSPEIIGATPSKPRAKRLSIVRPLVRVAMHNTPAEPEVVAPFMQAVMGIQEPLDARRGFWPRLPVLGFASLNHLPDGPLSKTIDSLYDKISELEKGACQIESFMGWPRNHIKKGSGQYIVRLTLDKFTDKQQSNETAELAEKLEVPYLAFLRPLVDIMLTNNHEAVEPVCNGIHDVAQQGATLTFGQPVVINSAGRVL